MGKCESLDIKEIEKYLLEETQIISKPIRE